MRPMLFEKFIAKKISSLKLKIFFILPDDKDEDYSKGKRRY